MVCDVERVVEEDEKRSSLQADDDDRADDDGVMVVMEWAAHIVIRQGRPSTLPAVHASTGSSIHPSWPNVFSPE